MFKGLLAVVAASVFSVNAFAAFVGPGSMGLDVVSVQKAMTLADDTAVTLEGSIIRQTQREHYIFMDKTGEVAIEISDEDFLDVTVKPEDMVKIYGEVDKDKGAIEIDVKHIQLVK